MRLPNIGQLSTMLGLGIQGYQQDEATRLQRQRQAQQDSLAQQKFTSDQAYQNAQIGNFQSEATKRTADAATAASALAGKQAANRRAFGMIEKVSPTHPILQGGFDENTDYTEEAKGVIGAWRDAQKPKGTPAGMEPHYDSDRGVYVYPETATFKPIAGLPPKPAPPQTDHFTFLPGGVDQATQKPIYLQGNTAKGTLEPTNQQARVPAGAGAQNAPQMGAARANLETARQIMDDFEEKYKAGKVTYTPLEGMGGALASSPEALTAKGPMGAVHSYLANKASALMQEKSPELARYMAAKKFVAEAILNTHKRPNQTQYEIEQELSGMGPGTNPLNIELGKGRRDKMWNEVFNNPNAGATAGPSQPTAPGSPTGPINLGAPTQQQKDWDAAAAHAKALGKDPVTELGPRP